MTQAVRDIAGKALASRRALTMLPLSDQFELATYALFASEFIADLAAVCRQAGDGATVKPASILSRLKDFNLLEVPHAHRQAEAQGGETRAAGAAVV